MKSTRKLVAAMFASLLAALPGWATGQSASLTGTCSMSLTEATMRNWKG